MDNRVRACLAELIGAFALVFFGAGAVCAVRMPSLGFQPYTDLIVIALAGSCALAVALTFTLNVSGGFLNPAVTLTLWVFKRMDGIMALGLVGAQILGAALAGGVLRLICDGNEAWLSASRLGTPHLNPEVFGEHVSFKVLSGGIGVEMVFGFLYTFAVFGTIIDRRAPRLGGLGAGLVQAAIVLIGFQLTGGSANPVRWFGTVVWEYTSISLRDRAFVDHPVYWMGPILGALFASAIYVKLILPDSEGAES
jgi:glycerol uptake facilitator-like aquaporin